MARVVSDDDCFPGEKSFFFLFDWIISIRKQMLGCIRSAIFSFNFKVLICLAND